MDANSQNRAGFSRAYALVAALKTDSGGHPIVVDRAWRTTSLLLLVGLVAIISSYWPATEAAVTVWYNSAAYNHCFLIPIITGYLLWEKRADILPLRPQPALWPLPFMLGIAFVALLGNVMSIMEIQHFALVALIVAFILSMVGWAAFKVMAFPIFYLFFMVPSGEFLVPRLQDVTAGFVVFGLQLVGIPVFSDGIFIKIPNALFEVAEACAGLRFLIASVAFGFLFAYLMYRSWPRRIAFVILSFIVPIIANGIRAFGIVMVAHVTDGKVAAGVDHIVYGWGFFVFILLLMMWLGMRFREDGEPVTQRKTAPLTVAAGGGYPKALVGMLALVIAVAAPAYGYWLDHRGTDQQLLLAPPRAELPWQANSELGDGWSPIFAGADREMTEAYASPQGAVRLYIAYYAAQRQGAKIISAQNRIEDGKTWRRSSTQTATAVVDGQPMAIAKQLLTNGQMRRVVWYFYWVDGQLTASSIGAKLLGARGTLLSGNPQAAVVVLATDELGSEQDAEHRLQEFLNHLQPLAPFLRQVATR